MYYYVQVRAGSSPRHLAKRKAVVEKEKIVGIMEEYEDWEEIVHSPYIPDQMEESRARPKARYWACLNVGHWVRLRETMKVCRWVKRLEKR